MQLKTFSVQKCSSQSFQNKGGNLAAIYNENEQMAFNNWLKNTDYYKENPDVNGFGSMSNKKLKQPEDLIFQAFQF